MDYRKLVQAVSQDAALRRRQILQPVGGKGDKIFPPTYPEERRGQGPRHVFERRCLDGRQAWCVLVDSVQSQANRLEEALLAAVREKAIALPYVTVDFGKAQLAGISEITSLDAPHRVYDAILRDSLLGKDPFMKSALGMRLAEAKPQDASALLTTSPTALLFGAWHSTGEGGGLGAKFPRCLVSEIVAVDVPVEDGPADGRTGEIEVRTSGRRTGSRIDPLGVLRRVEVFKGANGWDTAWQRLYLEKRGLSQVRPDIVVLGWNWNDLNVDLKAAEAGVRHFIHAEGTWLSAFRDWPRLRDTHLYRWLYCQTMKTARTPTDQQLATMRKSYAATMTELGVKAATAFPAGLTPQVPINDKRMYPIYVKCIELDIPVNIHASINFSTRTRMDHGHPLKLDAVMVHFPELRVVASPPGWPWVKDLIGVAWRHPNVSIGLLAIRHKYLGVAASGYEPLLRYGNSVLQDRMIFGTAFPMVPVARALAEIDALPLKPEVREKWLWRNAARVLGLGGK